MQPSRTNLSLPRGVSIDSVTKILERGHGYEWMWLNQEVIFGLRPNLFSLDEEPSADQGENRISSDINVLEPLGSDTLFFFNLGNTEVVASLPPLQDFKAGDRLPLKIDMRKMHLFDPSTEKMI